MGGGGEKNKLPISGMREVTTTDSTGSFDKVPNLNDDTDELFHV